MFKKVALICALAAFLAYPAYAEVQNIKVSGDITAMGVYRNNYDLEGKYWTEAAGYSNSEDQNSFLMSIVKLRVDADLTDNVSACVRLANLREWDLAYPANDDITLNLAYITLKEMLYSPLTVIIGRQELKYGEGLIVGPGLYQDSNAIRYDDLSPLSSYDAVRAILDYEPWSLNLIMAKMYETDDDSNDQRDSDIDLYGANAGYKFANYDAEVEGYLFYKRDPVYDLHIDYSPSESHERTFTENEVYALGLRGSVVPKENFTLSGEVAGQFGEIRSETDGRTTGSLKRDREALAVNVTGKYTLADVRFTPVLGVEYLYLSGEEYANDGDFEAWDPMYRSKVTGTIRDALETTGFNQTIDGADTGGWTNQHSIKATGMMNLGELVDGLSLDLAYIHYWFDEEPIGGADDDIGDEVDLKVYYSYTEDVLFGLDSAVFLPGDYYDTVHSAAIMTGGGQTNSSSAQSQSARRESNDPAVSVVGFCQVTF